MDRTACNPGITSENEQAANMTPAPKPKSVSCTRSDNFCENSTGKVPSAVAKAATEPPMSALKTTGLARTSPQTCDSKIKMPATMIANPSPLRKGFTTRIERG